MSHYDDKVMGLVARPDYQPMTLKALARRFQIGPDEYAAFRAAVRDLVRRGRLDVNKDKTLVKASEKGAIIGTFRRSAKGFGFVRPKGTANGRLADIFIPPDAGLDASTGDEVAVQITKRPHTPGYNLQGRVVRVLERASGLFVGTYFERGGAGYVKVDGTTFHEPIYVGDPGAKGAKRGDKVAFEMVRYPSPDQEGEGVITEILGPRGKPGVDTLAVIRAFNLPDKFDDEVLQEAREQAKKFDEKDIGDRLDLRDVLTVTIDPATARDFDDAITLARDERGYWHLGVHIADVGHFVRAGSALDRSARKRGNSVYLPDRVLPMLPEILSNSLASLQQGHTRYTVSALLEFNPEGIRTDRRFARSVIKVDHRFTYEEAYEAMMNPDRPIEGLSPALRTLLNQMLELAMILRRRRFERGALELNMPEVEIELGDKGEVIGAHLAKDDESHQVIEEFMLAANEAVAEYLTEKKVLFLRRGHADPEPAKLREFADFARSLGYPIERPQSRFELQRILRETADKPERYAIHYGLLRSLKQATYTPEREGHYALASVDYCHFTSPIRRYPDLQVHRQLKTLLTGHKPKADPDELAALGEHCSRAERRAEAAERELIKIKLLTHLEGRLGEVFPAVIIGVEDFGFFAQLVELPVEGLVHVTSLADDYYYLEPETYTLVGRRSGRRYRLGDRLDVRVARVDVDRRELDLVLPDHDVEVGPPPR
ncbi:MAG: ribonuclease R, partial [Isosphaeraceae bacterium]|nr:ribonuclease R [Isosphaeraceae bacterium]